MKQSKMQAQTHQRFNFPLAHRGRSNYSPPRPFSLSAATRKFSWNALDGFLSLRDCQTRHKQNAILAAASERVSGLEKEKKRPVVEHICLIKAKDDISDEQEKDMLDYLFTTQYQMRGIIAISLGRIVDENPKSFTHAVYMRFQKKEDLGKFYENAFYEGVLRDRVRPYCHGMINVDYESEVEDDILAIFRKGEEFNYGVEFLLLIEFVENSYNGPAEDALLALDMLTLEFPSLIVQATKGPTINLNDADFTHAVVIRFRSSEAFKMFMDSSEYKNIKSSDAQLWERIFKTCSESS